MLLKLAVLSLAGTLCQGFLFGRDQANWDGLKVTWGLNPFSSFASVPRTKSDAVSGGWVAMVAGQTCDSNPKFRGERYWKDNDLGVILIFDPHGYIAGIQAGIPKDYPDNPNHYPFTDIIDQPVVLDGNTYFVTAYFVDPAGLCKGRTPDEFNNEGTGTGLWIQNGTNPVAGSVRAPARQSEADSSEWTKGSCFVSMGHHYWYQLKKDMDCNKLFPVFLLYNEGVLNAFGWAFGMNIQTSKHLEHPPQSSYGNFMNPPPDCLANLGTLTTLHIYLTSSATADLC